MTRYDAMPDNIGFPLPKEILQADQAATDAERRLEQLRGLTLELALPKATLRQRLDAIDRRNAAGLSERMTKRPYVPGTVGAGPMGTTMDATAAAQDPSALAGHTAELAGSPIWARCVELAVNDLGLDADKLALRDRAMRFFMGSR
jgi:hypothetical protein